MENSRISTDPAPERHDDYAMLSRAETLVRLYELLAAYEARFGPGSFMCPYAAERARNGEGTPHQFRFGCCRAAAAQERDADERTRAAPAA